MRVIRGSGDTLSQLEDILVPSSLGLRSIERIRCTIHQRIWYNNEYGTISERPNSEGLSGDRLEPTTASQSWDTISKGQSVKDLSEYDYDRNSVDGLQQ